MRTLLEQIEDFLLVHPEVTASELGKASLNDKYLVHGLRKGRSPREATVIRVRRWMAEYARLASERTRCNEPARRRVRELVREVASLSGAEPARPSDVEAVTAGLPT